MYYTAVASPRVCCATILIHIFTAASSELTHAWLRFNMLVLLLLLLLLLLVVCATVCGSEAPCGSASGSLWLCARHCAAVHLVVYVWQCARQCAAVRHCAAVCNSMRQFVWQFVVVRTVMCEHHCVHCAQQCAW